MNDGNYEKMVSLISKSSKVGRDEVEKRISAKREKISGLISKEGAAQIIAAELGVSFDNEKLKIDELLPGMRKVNIIGKVINISPVRTFTTKNGQEGKVTNLVVADETSNIKVVLWDTNHISLVERNEVACESVIEIGNAMMRDNELHLGNFSELKLSNELLGEVKKEKILKEKNISELKPGDASVVRGFVVQAFEPRGFRVCPECKKKVLAEGDGFKCEEHGKVAAEERFLINLVLDDGTGTIRIVIFHDNIKNLGFTEFEKEHMSRQKENLLGKEMFFSGNARMNKFFNNLEFIANEIREPDVDELIKMLERK